ncbi:N-acetylmuramoyl-L-alanine amidase [Bacillus paranthracis]|uniref:N-acetylmuramoyl-L-alanine amidase n=1 Tax=Bacillus paranthracis TaxID=2026186 RepID=UPI003D1F1E5F
MKKLMKQCSVLFIMCIILFSSSAIAFADRQLIIQELPKTPYRGGVGNYEGVVAHSTATPEAPAINIRTYETRTWKSAFVHYAVDWNEVIQIASTDYMAYGAGPAANKRFVHVELCETSNPSKFKLAYEKYVKLLAKILRDRNIDVDKGLWTHNDVQQYLGGTTHTDPLDYLRSHNISENQFRADVKKAYYGNDVKVTMKPAEEVQNDMSVAYIEGYNINLRLGPSTNHSIIRKLQKGETYRVWDKKGDWLNLGGKQWIYYDSSYIHLNREETVKKSRLVSKVNDLRFYSKPSWSDEDVYGTVQSGLGFSIDQKVMVSGSWQYKVHNSNGQTFYITANENFIKVE